LRKGDGALMRSYRIRRLLLPVLIAGVALGAATWPSLSAAAQAVKFSREGVGYELELPSSRWRAVERLDMHDHFEFVYGEDRSEGYLRVREYVVEAGTTPEDLFRREESFTLKWLPGYVVCAPCEGEKFSGKLSGAVFAYEYTGGGEVMAGRVYYLEVNRRSFYSLHFTGEAGKLRALKGQADSIARSFRLR
jgi:hypothetical protein